MSRLRTRLRGAALSLYTPPVLRSTLWRKLRVAFMTGLVVGGAAAFLAYRRGAEVPEHWVYDLMARAAAPHLKAPPHEPVVLVAIDDTTLDELRRMTNGHGWPIPRQIQGRVALELKDLGAKVTVVDSLFNDLSPRGSDDDVEFVDDLRKAGNVIVVGQTSGVGSTYGRSYGRWAVRLAGPSDRETALAAAIPFLAHDQRPYLVPEGSGRFGLWLGGYKNRDELENNLSGLAELMAIPFNGPPAIRQLTQEEMSDPVDAEDWVTLRDAIQIPGLEQVEMPVDDEWLLPQPAIAASALHVAFANDTARLVGFGAQRFSDPDEIRNDDFDKPTTDVERSVRLFVRKGDKVYPSLALAALLATNPGKTWIEGGRFHYGDRSVPLSRRGFMNVTYPASEAPFGAAWSDNRPIDFAAVLLNAAHRDHNEPTNKQLEEAIKGRIVVVANVASDLYDTKATLTPNMNYGSGVVAAALRTLLLGDAVSRAVRSHDARLAFFLALFGALYALIVFRYARSTAYIFLGGVGMLAAVALFYGYALHLFIEQRLWISTFTPAAAFALASLGTGWINFGEESNDRSRVTAALGRFTSKAIVDRVLLNPGLIAPERRELTIFFSDIAGFTTISESLPAARLAELLSSYFGEMTEPIIATHGHVDKFIGDAIMAFWNAPLYQAEHAILGCRAALSMRERLDKLRPQLQKEFGVEVRARAGINSGEVVVGEFGARGKGDEAKTNYTAMGDAVNLASRLEGVNKVYGTEILVGERTAALAEEEFTFRELDRVRVKGKNEAVGIFELVSERGEKLPTAREAVLRAYADGLAAYRARQFDAALSHFERALAADASDGPSQVFLERCKAFIAEPPPEDWDGAHTLHEK